MVRPPPKGGCLRGRSRALFLSRRRVFTPVFFFFPPKSVFYHPPGVCIFPRRVFFYHAPRELCPLARRVPPVAPLFGPPFWIFQASGKGVPGFLRGRFKLFVWAPPPTKEPLLSAPERVFPPICFGVSFVRLIKSPLPFGFFPLWSGPYFKGFRAFSRPISRCFSLD